MSFLSGILDLGKSAVQFLSGNTFTSTLARTVLIGLAVNKLSKNALKGNDGGKQANIDQGVRLQAKPNASAKIPVLYGSAFFGGNITDAVLTNNNKTMWYCLVLSEKTGNVYSTSTASSYTFNNVYWNNQRIIFNSDGVTVNYTVDSTGIIDRNLSGLVKIYFYAGGRTAGQLPVGYTGTVPNAETLFPNWTSGTHAMDNLVFALVRVDYNREKGVTSLGDVLFQVTNSMLYPGDVLYDYMTSTTYGAGISSADLLTADITALNTYSQDSVAYDSPSGIATLADRYQINGLVDTEKSVLENAEQILSAAASWLSYDAHIGKWGIVINKTASSQASFNDSNIIGNIALSGTGLQDLYNQVKVEFPHRELRDSADFYNIAVPTSSVPADWIPFSLNTNEETNILNLTYDIINEPVQAQMLGLIELKQSRLDKVIQFQTDFSFYNLKAGDIIDVTNSRFAFNNTLFRIISINEIQDDGALKMEITALQYDVNVYSIDDLYRFTRTTADGIISFGSIGIPGTPTVVKYETDARPRIEITSTAPTGIVEGLEFWLTTDVNIPDDTNRSYTLIGIKKPTGGGVYTSGTAVTLEYITNASDFYVKTRGFNTTTVGGFSNVSGLVEFEPTQITDGIGPNTGVFDSTGGLLTALAAIELLMKVDGLFGGNNTGSIIDKVLDFLWPDRTSNKTAAELLQEDTAFLSQLSGTINNLNNVSIDELQDVDTTTTPPTVNDKLVWNGSNWVPSGATEAGAAIVAWGRFMLSGDEMLIDSSFNFDTKIDKIFSSGTNSSRDWKFSFSTAQPGNAYVVLTSVGNAGSFASDGTGTPPSNGQVFTSYNHTTNDFILHADSNLASGNVIYIAVVGVTGVAGANLLSIISRSPVDRTTHANPLTASTASDEVNPLNQETNTFGQVDIKAPITITYNTTEVYSLSKGSGTARLYKSNGTLAASLPAANLQITGNVVTLPFPDRDYGTDYYILMDRGMVTGQGEGVTYISPQIGTPVFWNFHTRTEPDPAALEPTQTLPRPGTSTTVSPPALKAIPETCVNLKYLDYITQSKYKGPDHTKVHRQSLVKLVFNNPIMFGTSGTITVGYGSTTAQTLKIEDTFKGQKVSELLWIEDNKLVVNVTKDFIAGTSYWLTITANCVYDKCKINGNEAILDKTKIVWTVDPGPTPTVTSI